MQWDTQILLDFKNVAPYLVDRREPFSISTYEGALVFWCRRGQGPCHGNVVAETEILGGDTLWCGATLVMNTICGG